jgi:hypothetical protein
MEAVQRFGWKDVKSIAQHVGTRTPTQVRTHAQKLFLRQQKESTGIMAPAKNGRSEGLPPLVPKPGGSDDGMPGDEDPGGVSHEGRPSCEGGASSDAGAGDQLQALHDASYQIAGEEF